MAIMRYALAFDGITHVACKKEDKLRGQYNSVMLGNGTNK
eukprot:SAG11_NODE_21957_length_415_cov_0.661392_1_plen_40_part_00